MHFFRIETIRLRAILFLIPFAFTGTALGQNEQRSYIQQRHTAIGQFIQGHFDRAEAFFLAGLHGAESARDDFSAALNLSGLGDVFQSENRLNEAEDAYHRSLSLLRRVPGTDVVTAIVYRNLASACIAGGHYAQAEKALNEASRISQTLPRPSAQLSGQILNSFGMLHFYQGRDGKAARYFESSIQTYKAAGPSLSADVAQALNNLAEVDRRRHRFKQAEDAYKESIVLTQTHAGTTHPDLILMFDNLGDLYLDLKRYDEAESAFQHSISILETTTPVLADRMIHALHGLSKAYLKRDQPEMAERALARAASIGNATRVGMREVPALLETYSALLDNIGKRQQAEEMRARALRTRASQTFTVGVLDLN
jgi:tetratricopeptide (TPR) repeat protein